MLPTDRPLHVVIVDEELPYPMISGKRIRTTNLILRLAQRHRITLLTHRNSDSAELAQANEFFRDHGVTTIQSPSEVPGRSVASGGVTFYARLAANLLSPRPYLVDVNNSPELRRTAAEYGRRHAVDLWQVEWTPYAEVLRGLPVQPSLVMAHNIESLIWQRYWETESNPVKRWYIERQWRKFEAFERRTFAECTQLVMVSEADAVLARERYGAERTAVVDNGVDTAYFQPPPTPGDPRRILFLGSLDWRPNLDAARLLLEQVFPAVRAQEPDARLSIVGRNPPPWLTALASQAAGVELHASVPDVRPYLAAAGMLAVPLRVGGGSRLKILEALAAGLPVVSTRVGAEGLDLEPGRHISVVEQVSELAPALIETMRQPAAAQLQAQAGRQRVLAAYDWDALADRLERIWFDCTPVTQPTLAAGVLS